MRGARAVDKGPLRKMSLCRYAPQRVAPGVSSRNAPNVPLRETHLIEDTDLPLKIVRRRVPLKAPGVTAQN